MTCNRVRPCHACTTSIKLPQGFGYVVTDFVNVVRMWPGVTVHFPRTTLARDRMLN